MLRRNYISLMFIIIIISLLSVQINSKCSFTQTCDPITKVCSIPEKKDFEPQNFEFKNKFQCPEFTGPTCCNSDQNDLLMTNFNLINYTFGSAGNGCDICAANMFRFWCWFTCHPDQADFVNAYDHITVKDPITGQMAEVLNVTIKVTSETGCQLYQSCKTTAYVAQVPAMQSDKGLMNFLGDNAVSQGKEKITMIYSNNIDDKPINLTLHKCNETFYRNDSFGYPVAKNCTCNNCDLTCGTDVNNILTDLSVWDGFNATVIIAFYSAIVGETIICLIIRRFFKNKRKKSDGGVGLFIETKNN